MSNMPKPAYEINELPPNPHIHAARRYRKYLYYAAHAATWMSDVYFIVRLGFILSAAQTWQMWLMIAVEWIFARVSRQNQLLTVAAGYTSPSPRTRLRVQGTEILPRIDVLIPCCGEPLDVILDTVRAACTIDYPVSQFRVLVLDDGGSVALRDSINDLRSKHTHLTYHTRGTHSGRVFAKAGNLNYALFSLQESFQPEYCAILDADCIPAPEFLRATLPHLLLNPQAALLTTRQYYYNLPAGDPLSQSRIHFYACHNADLSVRAAAIDAGSGALFRRSIILDVGGYPTFSFSEDWQLSLILQGRGHKTLQVEEPLQFGLVPTTLQGHIAQRNRWNIGHAQQIRALVPPTSKSLPRRLQWDIAVNGVSIVGGLLGYFVGYLAVPVLAVSRGLIPETSSRVVKIQVVLAVFHVGLTWLYAWLQVASTGFRVSLFSHLENSWLAGTQLFAILKFYCVTSKPKGSFVTGSSANSWNRATTLPRYTKILQILSSGAMFGILLFCTTVCAVLFSIFRSVTDVTDITGELSRDSHDIITCFLTTTTWPPLLHICYLSLVNNWVPVTSVANPPRYPERVSQLQDNKRGVRLPSSEVQREMSYQRYSNAFSSVSVAIVPLVLVGVLVGALLM
ncbi:glycosyltransferase family 2 protein [Aspergillus lucknowensis]|uniref:Nucleotide-diphospho-sugar transferase n=1 Tax=Aspergillus lucknowensis TaxID=176173 RepID=A0ABR4LNF2_9EURO